MENYHNSIMILLILTAISSLILMLQPEHPTGFSIYEGGQESKYTNLDKTWNFSNPEEYSYNSSEILINSSQASLKPIITEYKWTEESRHNYAIVYALYDSEDKLSKVNQKDNDNLNIKEDEIFDIKFNDSLYNHDIISIYLKSGQASEIFICNFSEKCSSPGYGLLSYNDQEGWYNITLSNMEDPMSSFNINSNDKVKIDFIQATKINITNYSSTNITYPESSILYTIELDKIRKVLSAEFSSELNNQAVNYKYSSDSGATWNNIPEDFSSLNISKIKFSATLNSDTLSTPILKSISIIYNKSFPKLYHEANTSLLINLSSLEPTIINKSNIILNLTTSKDVNNANITIKEFSNPSLEFKKYLRNLIDITVDDNTKSNLNSTKIEIHYTDADISGKNLNESTLKFYYYNETSSNWQELNSMVNTEKNFIEVSLSHLSIYGVFGDEIPASQENDTDTEESSGSTTQESEDTTETKSNEVTETPPEIIKEEQESPVTKTLITEESLVEEPLIIANEETEKEGVTGFTIFGIEIEGIDLGSFLVLTTGFLLAISYGSYRIIRKHRKQPEISVYIDKNNKVGIKRR